MDILDWIPSQAGDDVLGSLSLSLRHSRACGNLRLILKLSLVPATVISSVARNLKALDILTSLTSFAPLEFALSVAEGMTESGVRIKLKELVAELFSAFGSARF